MAAFRSAFVSVGSTIMAGLLMLVFFVLAAFFAYALLLITGVVWFSIPVIVLAAPGSIPLGGILGARVYHHFARSPKA